MEASVFHRLAGDPDPAVEAYRVSARDGVGLRVVLFRPDPASRPAASPQGTVLLFQGRTEYVEKYAPVARRLTDAGYTVLAIDWRGQGASDRLLDDPRPGHVGDFADYQNDVAAMVAAGDELGLPRPWHVLAHSMGATIALRALTDGLDVASAAFSAPMWGIRFGRLPGPVGAGMAGGIARAARRGGRGLRAVSAGGGVLDTAFRRNLLTSDLEAYLRMMREAAAWPDLTLDAPSYDWVGAALRECRALARLPSPDLPALIALCGRDLIVDPAPIRRRAAAWPRAQLLSLPDARHEPLFEAGPVRDDAMAAVLALFAGTHHPAQGPRPSGNQPPDQTARR